MLTVRSLVVEYGKARALHEVSFSVNAGEIVSLLGSNGAGKTTTLNAISGLRPVRRGSIEFAGQTITNWPADHIVRLGISQVPEGRRLFGTLSVEENLRIGAYCERQTRAALAARMDYVFALFPRLADRRRQFAGNLSGGEQQMVAVGRALMSKPLLLMLDEPSLGLSPLLTRLILHTVALVAEQGTAVLLVEQNAREALRMSARAYILENGRVALFGPSSDLLSDGRVQALYLGGNARSTANL